MPIGIATWLEAGRTGFKSRQRQEIFIFSFRLWGPPSLLSNGFRALYHRQGCEDENSPPSSAELNKCWNYISTPQNAFMA
jgi:hypothetical protein